MAKPPLVIAWADILRVLVFKRDLYTVDLICVAIVSLSETVLVELNEEDDGFQQLLETLPQYLPGASAWREIFPLVAHPAFETNWTVMFERQHAGDVSAR